MSKYSNYVEQIGIDWFLGNAVPAAPSSLSLHAYNESPTDTGLAGTDVSVFLNGIGPIAIVLDATVQDPLTYSNIGDLSFGEAQNQVNVSALAIKSGSNLICFSEFTEKTIAVGNELFIPVGAITAVASGWLSAALRIAWTEYLFEGQTLAALSGPNYWVAPFDGDPEGAGTEVTVNTTVGNRIQLTFSDDGNGQASNTNEADFGLFTANSDVDHWALFTAQSGGTLIHKWSVTAQSGVSGEDSLVVKTGNYVVKFD